MNNTFNWASGRPPKKSEHPTEERAEQGVPFGDVLVPDNDGESRPDDPTIPDLRIIGDSSESEDDGFDPYDTAVLVKK